MIRILLVDDQPIFQEAMHPIINAQTDMCIAGRATTSRDAIALSKKLRPDIVLLDFSLPDGNGLETMRAILAERPETKIIFVTVHANSKLLVEAIRGGAKGYIVKDVSINEFLGFVRGVHAGKAAISPGMVGELFNVIAHAPTLEPDPPPSRRKRSHGQE